MDNTHELRLAKRMARLGTETAEELRMIPGSCYEAWLLHSESDPTNSACSDSSKRAISSSEMTVGFCPSAVAGRAIILFREDRQPTTAALLEMSARRFLRSVGEKRKDGSVSLLHA
jgi:hypothetical protein